MEKSNPQADRKIKTLYPTDM